MSPPLVTAMSCVTISCPEPDRLINLITEAWEWELFSEGSIDAALESIWGITPSSAGDRFSILRSKNFDRGMIRVVEGPDRHRTSPMSTRWSGVEIVVSEDLLGLCRRLEAHPDFDVVKPVDEADFTHAGANVHTFFHGRGPGLTHTMFTMAVTQPETYAFPETDNHVGHIFDVHLDVNNKGPSWDFYEKTLCMDMVFDDMLTEGLFYDTWDLDPSIPHVRMSIFKGDAEGFGLGGIEMRSFDASTMDSTPPFEDRLDGGSCITTFTTKDIDAVFKAIDASPDSTPITEPQVHAVTPYGGGKVFAFLGPEGERVEIAEKWIS